MPGIRSAVTQPNDRTPMEAGGHISSHPPGLPIRVDNAQATVRSIYSAFGARRHGETLVVQVIIGLGHPPRALPTKITDPSASLWASLSHGRQLAPAEMRSRIKATAEQANLDVSIRIGASAPTPERRKRLVVELVGAMATAQSPGVRMQLVREDIQRLNAARHPVALADACIRCRTSSPDRVAYRRPRTSRASSPPPATRTRTSSPSQPTRTSSPPRTHQATLASSASERPGECNTSSSQGRPVPASRWCSHP